MPRRSAWPSTWKCNSPPPRALISVCAFLCLFAFARAASADPLSLPLNGYFHPGRAMPVAWDLNSADNATLTLSADQSITSRVQVGNSLHGVFPWLVAGQSATGVRWQAPAATGDKFSSPLHPLDDSDRLVGLAVDDPSVASDLFPGYSPVVVRLDARKPIEGPAMAWETLDAIVFSPQQFSSITDSYRRQLLSVGVELAVTGASPPDNTPAWQQTGRLWVAQPSVPLPAVVNSEVFTPTQGWVAGKSSDDRTRFALLALIFCLLVGAVKLWNSRWMPAAMVIFCAASAAALAWDNPHHSPISSVQGDVILSGRYQAGRDHWLYQTAHRAADFTIPADGSILRPIVADVAQIDSAKLVFNCGGDGNVVSLSGEIQPDVCLAVVARHGEQKWDGVLASNLRTPLRRLATSTIYPGFSLYCEMPDDPWPAIVLTQDRQDH